MRQGDQEYDIPVTVALDHELEDKFLGFGPFTAGELFVLIILTSLLTGILMLVHMLLAASALVIFPVLSSAMIALKRRFRHKSWMWDLCYGAGLIGGSKGEIPRARWRKTFAGERRVVRSPFTRSKAGGLVPGSDEQLYYGIPPIGTIDEDTGEMGRSITPQGLGLSTIVVEEDVFAPGSHRRPRRFRYSLPIRDGKPYDPLWDFGVVAIAHNWKAGGLG